MQLRELLITYLYILSEYYHTKEDGVVLGCPIHDSQCKIPLIEYRIILPL